MVYSVNMSKKRENEITDELINEFESPVKYNTPSPPETELRSVRKKYEPIIDTIYIKKIAKKLGQRQLSLDQIK